ncbi:hypothetical protein BGW80DRAFT_1457495 [Lactifluus volemus]|nr:hypothetical protein BGW80DRAFT_1457495 [Lactifluus volemus]
MSSPEPPAAGGATPLPPPEHRDQMTDGGDAGRSSSPLQSIPQQNVLRSLTTSRMDMDESGARNYVNSPRVTLEEYSNSPTELTFIVLARPLESSPAGLELTDDDIRALRMVDDVTIFFKNLRVALGPYA